MARGVGRTRSSSTSPLAPSLCPLRNPIAIENGSATPFRNAEALENPSVVGLLRRRSFAHGSVQILHSLPPKRHRA